MLSMNKLYQGSGSGRARGSLAARGTSTGTKSIFLVWVLGVVNKNWGKPMDPIVTHLWMKCSRPSFDGDQRPFGPS